MKNKKTALIIITLGVLLLMALAYIGSFKYNESKQVSYAQGMQEGYRQAIIDIISQSLDCKQVPLTVGNVTINFIAVECLRR